MLYIPKIGDIVKVNRFDSNTLGARLVNTLVHQYFIKGGKLDQEEVDRITFQNPIEF